MKKFFVTLVLVAISLIANAQFFVAGSVSASYKGGFCSYVTSENKIDKQKGSEFSVKPALGYMIPGKSYGFGLGLGYAYASVKDKSGVMTVSKEYSNTFDFGPFFRYAYAKFEKITLYVDAKIPISITDVNVRSGNVVEDLNGVFAIGVRLIPGLTYKFNNHILFTTEIGLLSLNYMHERVTDPIGNVDVTNEFNLGANIRQTAAFGFVYLF